MKHLPIKSRSRAPQEKQTPSGSGREPLQACGPMDTGALV